MQPFDSNLGLGMLASNLSYFDFVSAFLSSVTRYIIDVILIKNKSVMII